MTDTICHALQGTHCFSLSGIQSIYEIDHKSYFNIPIQKISRTGLLENFRTQENLPGSGNSWQEGEILRAGLHLLTKLNLAELKKTADQVEKVQTSRPTSSKI